MDERLKYEILIGGKLGSLPVPDMQDMIWQRIKAQLDIDLPPDENEGGSHSPTPSGPGLIGWGLSIVIIALVTSFFLLKNKSDTIDKTVIQTPTEQIVSPSQQDNSPPPGNNTKASGRPAITDANEPAPLVADSVARQDVSPFSPFPDDSAHTTSLEPSSTGFSSVTDTTGQVKKRRGLKGLSDSDYRIVPKNKNQIP
jgi:hypothetical protein